jgi:hypothetical protein
LQYNSARGSRLNLQVIHCYHKRIEEFRYHPITLPGTECEAINRFIQGYIPSTFSRGCFKVVQYRGGPYHNLHCHQIHCRIRRPGG